MTPFLGDLLTCYCEQSGLDPLASHFKSWVWPHIVPSWRETGRSLGSVSQSSQLVSTGFSERSGLKN